MGPDLDLKGRSETVMEASTSKENGSAGRELENRHIICASNYEDTTFQTGGSLGEQTEEANRSEDDVEVNITECTSSGDNSLVQAEIQDATENSSSFGNTLSEDENGGIGSDAEVMSKLRGNTESTLGFGEYGGLFRLRKKRVTSHWRKFIQPLLWRCKWVELQINELQSQARKYDSVLEENSKRKQLKLENFSLEGSGAKSMPFSRESRRKKAMKRKKRKRHECLMDTAAYMSSHNLFSYYGSRRTFVDAVSMDDDWGNRDKKNDGNDEYGVTDEQVCLDFRGDGDSLEQILWKIEVAQSQVSDLKTRLNKVMSENAGKFSSAEKLSLLGPCNALTSSTWNPSSPPNNGAKMPVASSCNASQLRTKYNMGDLLMPESATSSHGEVTHLPDIIESTDWPRVGGSCKNPGDGILIYNRRVKKELNEEVKVHPIEKHQVPKEEDEEVKVHSIEKHQVPKEDEEIPILPVPAPEDLPLDDQPTPKIRSISKLSAPNNKRKRAKRKAGSGRWSVR